MSRPPAIWAIVPAAGIGSRMQADIPKQYMLIDDRPVLAHVIERLLSVEQVAGLVVALKQDDYHWDNILLDTSKPIVRASGGTERSHSVYNALQVLQEQTGFDTQRDWVLVHDAVRPCVHNSNIECLISTVGENESGGLLAVPVRDTMKRQHDNQTVSQTVERDGLWHAQTPQLFSWCSLYDALGGAIQSGCNITDEASAMERAGYTPVLVPGSESNIKITHMADLHMAEMIIREGL